MLITPEERAKMFEEYNQEEIKQEPFDQGRRPAAEATARNLLTLSSLTGEEVTEVTGLAVEKIK